MVPADSGSAETEAAWSVLLDRRAMVDRGARPDALAALPDGDAAVAQLNALFGPLADASRQPGWVVAHLGQSVDGRIATESGHSHYVNGPESLVHLHRLRALCDAVVIGVGTAIADAPRLTTRRVAGPNPTRVVIDPRGRLPADSGLLRDGAAPTVVVSIGDSGTSEGVNGVARLALASAADGGLDCRAVVAALAERGLTRLLIEGGGTTVSRFLHAGCLTRLQLCVAPLLIGSGRPSLSLPVVERLDDALRPPCQAYRLGDDVLFDFDLSAAADGALAR